MPAPTRKSTSTLFIFVWPDLKSSPPISTPFSTWCRCQKTADVMSADGGVTATQSFKMSFENSSSQASAIFVNHTSITWQALQGESTPQAR